MSTATDDRISHALRLLAALDREDRRRIAARHRRRRGFLFATALLGLGLIAAAPAGISRLVLGGVGDLASGLRASAGLAPGQSRAGAATWRPAAPPARPLEAPRLRIIVSDEAPSRSGARTSARSNPANPAGTFDPRQRSSPKS